MKELRCKVCGEVTTTDELMRDGDGNFTLCPTCEGTKFFVIGTEEEIDTLVDEIEDEEEEEVMCTCIYCGDDFESDEDREVCDDCQEILDNSCNEDLLIALAEEFGCGVQDIVENGDEEWQIEGVDYYVLTEEEANERVADYIKEALWSFNPSCLADSTGLPIEVFEALADNDRCESNNEAIESCINMTCGMNEFVKEAVRYDGRGHFLSSYDGDEIEVITDNGEYYYCYRM